MMSQLCHNDVTMNFTHNEKLTAIVTVSASSKLSPSGKDFMSPAKKYKLYIAKHVYEHVTITYRLIYNRFYTQGLWNIT